MGWKDALLGSLGRIVNDVVRHQTPRQRSSRPTSRRVSTPPRHDGSYPGDFTGTPRISYQPHEGRLADPGEIVWTWVPYEEDHTEGKDRPVLIIGRDEHWLLALPLSSVDHDRDARQEASQGRYWVDIGTGSWDRSRRPSEVRVDRIVRVDPDAVRRIAARLDRTRFDRVAAGVRRHQQR